MQYHKNIASFNIFQKKIEKFKKNPKFYNFYMKKKIFRQIKNASTSFLIWLSISILLNFFAITYFINSKNPSSTASLLAVISLFLTIAARNYTVNFIMFDTIGKLWKNYLFHELANRIGFFHRFMALSTFIWFFVHYKTSASNSLLIYFLIAFIFLIMFSAIELFRRKNHNIFENIHRYLGYITIFLLIVYYFQSSFQNALSLNETILKVHFFILFAIVIMLISPWLGLEKINPKLVHVASHVIGISIKGKPSFGTYSKISLGNAHYHPFGDSMIDFEDMENRTLYLTPAGDRTSQIVNNANKGKFLLNNCTIKKHRNKGFMYYHDVYDHILIVVTGGGIAPIIPCLVLNEKTKIDVLWIGRSQEKEFTSLLLEKLLAKISHKEIGIHIIDTTEKQLKQFKNENYVALALEAHDHYKPEAVFVMSNQNLTIDMLYAFKERKVKTYAATFDS